ncbi:3-hydroxyisobutyryl-coenzyme A hydrolase [Sistotremastrum niveocremeum HHB9708]|uniref:3-hydroxyisobutyryl-CoA hydrolase n=2 Tax=Sistotremastraceae TaxID=3402574 RepID=A0A164QUU8_9AGAM|nr:3-hydroxyisobutyryl-coenzyme A hydrolase [Sistotremastrum niveocremeum HHB9708]KZT39218.1 3-hydroxyisobutyryl-coenzyme A hydrolase isoform 1 [Sistotremastrum suecicum HHB10207 ss-3]
MPHTPRLQASPLNIAQRVRMISNHVGDQAPVLFTSDRATRTFTLNRPSKFNALDGAMIGLLKDKIHEWNNADLCNIVIGRGAGRAFCAGGDVRVVVEHSAKEETRHLAVSYFKDEFELDYTMAQMKKPYVAVWDGHVMGGGVGLSIHARFRVATEKTQFAMPETKIGYCPDVGASFFLSRLDGELGTYLALTGNVISGRAVFEHRLATHFVPSSRIPALLDALASLENADEAQINNTIELFYEEPQAGGSSPLVGGIRAALDQTFKHNDVESILKNLEGLSDKENNVGDWAKSTLAELRSRSPTSLKVALEAVRRGQTMTLEQALQMEYQLASAFCSGATGDFITGVHAVLVDKVKGTPEWNPADVADTSYPEIISRFFDSQSPYHAKDQLALDEQVRNPEHFMQYSLPAESEVAEHVLGTSRESSSKGLNRDELMSIIRNRYPNKGGLDHRMEEIIARKCTIAEDPDNFHHVRWKH